MTPDEFWSLTPHYFWLKVEGYYNQQNRHVNHFRHLFSLTYNVNRGEKDEVMLPDEVCALMGETPKRRPRVKTSKGVMGMSDDQIAELTRRINNS